MNETIDLMQRHVSVREYKDEPVPKETLHQIIEAAQVASTTQFIQAYSVVHITDQTRLEHVANLANNAFITNSGSFLVMCLDMTRLSVAAEMHGKKSHVDNTEAFIFGVADTAIFTQNLVLGLESAGYGICYIGGVRTKIKEISEYLGLPKNVVPLFGLSIGVPSEINAHKPRLPLDAILHENVYSNDHLEQLLTEYDQIIEDYYNERSSNQKNTTWTKQMSEVIGAPRRPNVDAFVRQQGFLTNTTGN